MFRTFLVCALLTAISVPCQAEQTLTPTEMVIRLNVRPMAAPKPSLRYLLLPDLKEMNPGNPIPNYLRCFMEQRDYTPENNTLSHAALRQADWAARLDKPDWGLLLRTKTDGIGLLLPDLQKMRSLANDLKGRFEEEITQGRIDDALRTARTMFALSRHTGENPTLIGDLVAIAIAFVTIGPLEEMLEQPNCPNLYWALTTLPNPFITLDKGLEGERTLLRSEFREMDDRAPMSKEQIKKLIFHIDNLRQQEGKLDKKVNGARVWIDARIKDEKALRAARRRIIEYGIPEESVARFPADQVILLDEWREYEVGRDEITKFMYLPTCQYLQRVDRKMPARGLLLFDTLLPALDKVRLAQGRLEQRIAMLRHVEALRLYAADHDGKLPEKLSDCPVPLPDDPITGKPFVYKLEGSTAHLRGTPPRGMEMINAYNVRYELTIQK